MKIKYFLSIIAILGSLTGQICASKSNDAPNILGRQRSDSTRCGRCPIDIRQGPGFQNLDNQNNLNPFEEEFFDDDPMNFTPF